MARTRLFVVVAVAGLLGLTTVAPSVAADRHAPADAPAAAGWWDASARSQGHIQARRGRHRHRHHRPAPRGAPPQAATPIPAAPIPPPPTPAAGAPALLAIGAGVSDARTHVAFDAPGDLVAVSTQVVVDRVAPAGLNFFALQVNFTNGTWAHGGLQDVDGPGGTRTRQINWGGLVNRGGGTADYDQRDDRADLAKIQNPPPGGHVGPYAWQTGVAYAYRVERGAQVTLPPGDYRLIPGRPLIHLDRARTMWEWRFTVRPVDGGGATFAAVLYTSADAISSFYLWNESGYGATDAGQLTRWWAPWYRAADASAARAATRWHRF